jgi:hypothetical protein
LKDAETFNLKMTGDRPERIPRLLPMRFLSEGNFETSARLARPA